MRVKLEVGIRLGVGINWESDWCQIGNKDELECGDEVVSDLKVFRLQAGTIIVPATLIMVMVMVVMLVMVVMMVMVMVVVMMVATKMVVMMVMVVTTMMVV